MTATDRDWGHLCDEHCRVVGELGRAQRRASAVIVEQAKQIAALQAQAMQLRATAMIRETALAWAREELAEVKTAIAGLPKRLALAQQVRVLEERVSALTRGATRGTFNASRPAVEATSAAASPGGQRKVVMWIAQDRQPTERTDLALAETGVQLVRTDAGDAEQLNAGLADADLVICQAGCVSHGDWWRVKDYCSRTGKQCVLVMQPDALDRVIASRAAASADADD